jgi:hypothetical protein
VEVTAPIRAYGQSALIFGVSARQKNLSQDVTYLLECPLPCRKYVRPTGKKGTLVEIEIGQPGDLE